MEKNETLNTASGEKKISLMEKAVLIFTNPSEVFKNLLVYPNWIFPTLIVLALSIGAGFLLKDLQRQAQQEMIVKSEKIPEEQKSRILEGMEKQVHSPLQFIMIPVGITIYIFASFALVAALYLFTGNIILGGKAGYKSMLMIYAWGYLAAIPEIIIKVPLALFKNTIHIYTSLAILFDPAEAGTTLFKLANAIDLFSLWRVALWTIGFSIVYKFTTTKSTVVIASWYVIGVAVGIGFSALTGGMFGV